MASIQHSSAKKEPTWTSEKNKLFENALAIYDEDTPERWDNVVKLVGGTNVEEVKRQYQILLDDINSIESGRVPLPNYKIAKGSSERYSSSYEEQRLKHLKL